MTEALRSLLREVRPPWLMAGGFVLVVEPAAADDVRRLVATVVGVNAGALVTPWASLATLLRLQRCRSAGLRVPLLKLAGWGAVCATLYVTAATPTIR